MSDIFAFAGISLIAALLSALLRKNAPETALFLGAALLVSVLAALSGDIKVMIEEMRYITEQAGVEGELLVPLLKVLGISVITGAAGAVCADAGEKAAGFMLHLAGTVCAFGAVMPLLSKVVEMLLTYL